MPDVPSKIHVHRRKRPRRVLFLCGLLIILILAEIFWGERVRPLVLQFAEARCKVLLTDMINQAIADHMADEGLSGFDVMQFEKDEAGAVVAMQVDTVSVNRIKSIISLAVSGALTDAGSDELTFSIPLGNLSGMEWLSGHGPLVRCNVIYEGGLTTDLVNSFSSAGINQTHYQTLVSVSVSLSVAFPLAGGDISVTSAVPIAETVLMGDVPDAYTYIGRVTADDRDYLADYGANAPS